jgi:integrase/recombinase XerD
MLTQAVESYLAIRRAVGFALKWPEFHLKSFAAFSEARGRDYISSDIAIEWAGLTRSVAQRARRLGTIIRFARYLRSEDPHHEVPPAIFGAERPPRPTPYILTAEQIQQLIQAASQLGDFARLSHHHVKFGYKTFRGATYSTLFSLLACTGLRQSEAIHLRYVDITPDGLVIRNTKFRKSRLVPLHETARSALERYLQQRRPYAPFDDHVFVSLRRKPLLSTDVDRAFRQAVKQAALPPGGGRARPTPHSLRHTFAVRALETCPDGRDAITKHMLALSTYLGHSSVAETYWYLEAVPELMRDIAERTEHFAMGGQSCMH